MRHSLHQSLSGGLILNLSNRMIRSIIGLILYDYGGKNMPANGLSLQRPLAILYLALLQRLTSNDYSAAVVMRLAFDVTLYSQIQYAF